MKVELCAFSGKKIYPGHGRLYVRTDNRSFRFVDSKCLSLFLQRKKAQKIHWTIVFRRMHKKGITEEVAKKRTRKTVKVQRSIVGASLEKIAALRNEKPEFRAAAREKAIKDAKAKSEKSKAEKKAAGNNNQNNKNISKQQAKGARPAVAAKSR